MPRRYQNRDPRWIRAKYSGQCDGCGTVFRKYHDILYWPNGRICFCKDCGDKKWREFLSDSADEQIGSGQNVNPYAY